VVRVGWFAGVPGLRLKVTKTKQSSNRRPGKMSSMPEQIRILTVERDCDDGLIVTFSDGTTAAYVVEELMELRPGREPIRTPAIPAR
jgi:hypothetical protein